MTESTLRAIVPLPFADAAEAVRESLADAGFGVLTEIDLSATLEQKTGVTLPPQLILGACRPPLALQALRADPAVATMLPCNVVVAEEGPSRTRVETLDPTVMAEISPALAPVAREARDRLTGMMDTLRHRTEESDATAG